MRLAALLALSLATEPAPPAPAPAPVPALREHEGWRQDLGVGWHATTLWSNEGSHYTFHSFSLAYLASSGRTGLFVHASALLPLQARENGAVYEVSDYYRVRFGGDLLLGWHGRWGVGRDLEVDAGPGAHVGLIWLRGRVGYRDFSAMPVGVGGMGVLRWRPGPTILSGPVSLGGFASTAWDLYDPLRANDLKYGFTFRVGLLAGIASE